MAHFRYVVVGGGMTADAACRGIRDHDQDGAIAVFAAEPHPPYARPPLSKALWSGKDEATVWRGTSDLGVDVQVGRRIASLDPGSRAVVEVDGTTHTYDRVLLATGGAPRQLRDAHRVIHFRTLDDFRSLRRAAEPEARIVVIGGGFIGSEIAAALTMTGARVSMLFPEDGIGARLFPTPLSVFVNDYYREKGVEVLPGELVAGVETDGTGFVVQTESGRKLDADAVVAGLGIQPETGLAEAAGLEVDDGVLVDEYGRAGGRGDVFAAGDVARFPVRALGGTRRVEHEDHANTHGRLVGGNMAGARTPYDHLPFFYSDIFELGYEAVGDVDARLETVESWAEPNRKGVVGYVDDDGRARGFLLLDVWGKVDAARELIREGAALDASLLHGLVD